MVFLVLLNFIHLILMYYFEQIMPGNYGIAKPWYFPLANLKNLFVSNNKTHKVVQSKNQSKETSFGQGQGGLPIYIEDESSYANRRVGIKIKNLSKKFKQLGVIKQAVNDLSLNIYEGQISVLLGHNGAGKR
jgi:ATP-binding cassette subfamily A (ABC1) protein 3